MYCAQCGTKSEDADTFCSSCGEPLVTPAPSGGQAAAATTDLPPYPQASPAYAPPATGPGTPPPYSPPGYAATPYQGHVPAPTSTNGMAVAALICGILGVLGGFLAILALIFGYVAKGQIDRSNGRYGGRGMAIAGIVLGWIGLVVLVIVIIAIAANSNNNG